MSTDRTGLEVFVNAEGPLARNWALAPEGAGVLATLRAIAGPGREPLRAPWLSFLIRHPEHGPILVDTGLHPAAIRSPWRDRGLLMGFLFRRARPVGGDFHQKLAAVGVSPGEVRSVVMTHLHTDHTSAMRLLPDANFVCTAEEWKAANRPFSSTAGYTRRHLPHLSRLRRLDLRAEGEPFGPFEHTVDLLGDGAIRLISTPGHTPGHLSVLLRLPPGPELLLVGDAAYITANIEEQRPPLISADGDASRASLRAIAAYAAGNPATIIVPSHDPDAWRGVAGAQRG